MERLGDAGFLVEDLIPICFNCNTKGHGKSECPQPMEGRYLFNAYVERLRTAPVVCCINCGEEGHRMRDCPKERRDVTSGATCRFCEYLSFFMGGNAGKLVIWRKIVLLNLP